MSEKYHLAKYFQLLTEKYDILVAYLRCPCAEIVNILWFNFLEEDLTWAPIGANVKRAGFIPLGLKATFPQCFAPETTNSLIYIAETGHFICFDSDPFGWDRS